MKKITVMTLMGLWVFLFAHICCAEKAYVINTSKITLRCYTRHFALAVGHSVLVTEYSGSRLCPNPDANPGERPL